MTHEDKVVKVMGRTWELGAGSWELGAESAKLMTHGLGGASCSGRDHLRQTWSMIHELPLRLDQEQKLRQGWVKTTQQHNNTTTNTAALQLHKYELRESALAHHDLS